MNIPIRTYQNYERGEREPDFRLLASMWERGWNLNWVLLGEGQPRLDAKEPLQPALQSQSQDVSREDLTVAIALAQGKIEAARKAPTPQQFAEFVAEIYAALTQGLPEADIHDINQHKRGDKGDSNAGGQGVAKTG